MGENDGVWHLRHVMETVVRMSARADNLHGLVTVPEHEIEFLKHAS